MSVSSGTWVVVVYTHVVTEHVRPVAMAMVMFFRSSDQLNHFFAGPVIDKLTEPFFMNIYYRK